MQEFHIFICDALNKNQQKLDISDKEALDAYRMFYKSLKKINSPISSQNSILDYLTLLDNQENIKQITYSEYKNTTDKCFEPKDWGITKNFQFNSLWYMNQEIKDDFIKCAEYEKQNKQMQLDLLSEDFSNRKLINSIKHSIKESNNLIENLNYYYDRKMLFFTIF